MFSRDNIILSSREFFYAFYAFYSLNHEFSGSKADCPLLMTRFESPTLAVRDEKASSFSFSAASSVLKPAVTLIRYNFSMNRENL